MATANITTLLPSLEQRILLIYHAVADMRYTLVLDEYTGTLDWSVVHAGTGMLRLSAKTEALMARYGTA
jgi:hypothetical protein